MNSMIVIYKGYVNVNTCAHGECNAIQCTCVHLERIVTNEDSKSSSDTSVKMVFGAVGRARNHWRRDIAHPIHQLFVVNVGRGS